MRTIATDPRDMVRAMHHVGLPSCREDWDEIAAFWRTLGQRIELREVEQDDFDHAGAGPRLQIMGGAYQLHVSYFVSPLTREELRRFMPNMHVAVRAHDARIDALRAHPAFERETHWGYSNISVFVTGPYGLHIECVMRDSDFHREL